MTNKVVLDGLDRRLSFAEFPSWVNLNSDYLINEIIPQLESNYNKISKNNPHLILGGNEKLRTSLACGIAAQQMVFGNRVKYMPINVYIDMLRLTTKGDDDIIYELQHLKNDIEIFVWANVTTGTYTDWEKTNLYQAMYHRIETKGYNDIISTNFNKETSDSFKKAFGQDLYSLLFENERVKKLILKGNPKGRFGGGEN